MVEQDLYTIVSHEQGGSILSSIDSPVVSLTPHLIHCITTVLLGAFKLPVNGSVTIYGVTENNDRKSSTTFPAIKSTSCSFVQPEGGKQTLFIVMRLINNRPIIILCHSVNSYTPVYR
eukprot:sb/3476384/